METRRFDPAKQIDRKDQPSVELPIILFGLQVHVPLEKVELLALNEARGAIGFVRRDMIPGNWFMATRSREQIFEAARKTAAEIRADLDCGVYMRRKTRERLENTYRILEPFLPSSQVKAE